MITKKAITQWANELNAMADYAQRTQSIPVPSTVLRATYVLRLGFEPQTMPVLVCQGPTDINGYLIDILLITAMLDGVMRNRLRYNCRGFKLSSMEVKAGVGPLNFDVAFNKDKK